MTVPGLARSALVISTTPPIPREYGNRNRVFQTIEFLKSAGFAVSLLLYPFDEEWAKGIPPYYKELADQFEYFSVVPNTKELHRGAAGYHHTIDEWWDDAIGHQLAWLFKRKRYDILFVNYTFFSRAFDFAPKSTLRILDTHDLFTNRREAFERHGVSAEFFYTNAEQEKIAFDRADAIIAIKSSESDFIRTLTRKHVVTLPYWDSNPVFTPTPRANIRPVFSHDRPLRVGFIGAQNSVNVVNMQRFLHAFDRYVRLYNLPVEVVVAGNVCRLLHRDYSFLRKLGRVPRIEDFYQSVDAIIAPLEFSTGIKIKVGEALVWQLPVIATANAFDGFRSFHRTQAEASVATLCQSLASLATNELPFAELVMAARRAGISALKAQEKGFADLRAWIKSRMRRIVVITDRPFWYRGTYMDELITQTIEFVSHIAPTIVATLTKEEVKPDRVYAEADYVRLAEESSLSDLLTRTAATCNVSGAVVFTDDDALRGRTVKHVANLGIESWAGGLVRVDGAQTVRFRSSRMACSPIYVAPLRYAPILSEKRLEATRIDLFVPNNVSEWEAVACNYITRICRHTNLNLRLIEVSSYAEYSPDFMVRSIASNAGSAIIFENDATSRLFVFHAANYRGVRTLLLGENFVCPESVEGAGGLSSSAHSIKQFLDGKTMAHATANANTGWGDLWQAIEGDKSKR